MSNPRLSRTDARASERKLRARALLCLVTAGVSACASDEPSTNGAGGKAGYGAYAGQTSAVAGHSSAGQVAQAGGAGAAAAANGGNASPVAGTKGTAGAAVGGAGAAGTQPGGMGGGAAVVPQDGDIFVATDGKDAAAGTQSEPLTLPAALKRVLPGNTIFVRAGTYKFSAQITVERDNSGSDGKLKQLFAYENEKPILDFSDEPYAKADNPRGLQINGNYWHVKGLTVFKAADNGIYVAGNHNVIENCITHGNRDTGLQLGRYASSAATMADWPSDNLILNCESYDNYDAPPGAGENADGFAAKLTVGPGNVFRGCVSHHNSDDGWDLYTKSDTGPIGSVTIDQCIAHHNGTLTDGTSNENGDRNGFKLGGEKIAVAHTVTRSVAFANGKNGFTWNSNPGAIRVSNTLAFDNAEGNYRFGDNSTPTQAVFTNNLSFWTQPGSAQADKAVGMDVSGSNCFWTKDASKSASGLTVTNADFANALEKTTVTRGADGAPDFTPFELASKSALINAGVTPAQPLPFDATYYQGKPDLGAVEQ
ncbi:MAG: hypothetical protein RL701_6392 [Pseudomonadota bacterium]